MDQELREVHARWLQRKEEEEHGSTTTTQTPAEVETPLTFAPNDLPTTIDAGIPSSTLQDTAPLSATHDATPSSDEFANRRIASVSSPTLSVSSVSDLTPTELGDGIGEGDDERVLTRHGTFYLEDGNVEIVCGHTIFRVHSPVVAFSSPTLRDILSPSTILGAPTPEGWPRITVTDTAQDFAILLKMIYTPGWVPPFDAFYTN